MKNNILENNSINEKENNKKLFKLFQQTPIKENQLLNNLNLYSNRQSLARTLFFNNLYQKILNSQGIIIEFGTHWGNNLVLFSQLRSIYEPFNYTRKIVGFDTFEGFQGIDKNDGNSEIIKEGSYSTSKNYDLYLDEIMQYHENNAPLNHKRKYQIIKGNASKTIIKYLKENSETIISFVYFDFDIYKPTIDCLKAILPYLHKGSVIGFDELNFHDYPGETIAFREIFGNSVRINRDIHNPMMSWIEYG